MQLYAPHVIFITPNSQPITQQNHTFIVYKNMKKKNLTTTERRERRKEKGEEKLRTKKATNRWELGARVGKERKGEGDV